MGEFIKNGFKNAIYEMTSEFWVTLIESIKAMSYSVALVGAGIFIILYVVGYEKGARNAAMLFVAWVLITFLLA